MNVPGNNQDFLPLHVFCQAMFVQYSLVGYSSRSPRGLYNIKPLLYTTW